MLNVLLALAVLVTAAVSVPHQAQARDQSWLEVAGDDYGSVHVLNPQTIHEALPVLQLREQLRWAGRRIPIRKAPVETQCPSALICASARGPPVVFITVEHPAASYHSFDARYNPALPRGQLLAGLAAPSLLIS